MLSHVYKTWKLQYKLSTRWTEIGSNLKIPKVGALSSCKKGVTILQKCSM